MRGSFTGKMIGVMTFGESHGAGLGVVIDGIPSNLLISMDDLNKELLRRAPGQILGTTSRKEADQPEILSGVFEGRTLGTPIAVLIRNMDQKSADYNALKNVHRPGHGDLTSEIKYGIRDHRGGGRSSGRETVARVVAGYFSGLVIKNTKVVAYNSQIGHFKLADKLIKNLGQDFGSYGYPDSTQWKNIEEHLLKLKSEGDSIGGKVMVVIDGCPPGLGEPVFDKLKADLAKALLSIGACTGFTYGLGDDFADLRGSEVSKTRENFTGLEGGISNGERIVLELTFRAPSTVGEKAKAGRHDPCILPRVLPVVEAMVKMVIADHYLRQAAYENFNKKN